jgi:predicted phosphodiesterase
MRILAIPDLHEPYSMPGALEFCLELYQKFNIEKVVFLGDELDHHALSFYSKNPHLPSASDELYQGLQAMDKWYKAFPQAIVMKSNHGSRPFRVAHESGLPSQFLKDYKEYMGAPEGWEWVDELEIDGVKYSHGEDCKGGATGAYHSVTKHRQSCVYGHWHSFGGVIYSATKKDILFGLNCGSLINENSLAFAYGKHFPNRPTLGAGVILDGVGFFVPFNLHKTSETTVPIKRGRGRPRKVTT